MEYADSGAGAVGGAVNGNTICGAASGGTSGAVSGGDLNLDGIGGGGPISNANLLALVFGLG